MLRRRDVDAESALVVLVPEADPLVRALGRTDPAHVTVLYPFLPADRVGMEDEAVLREVCATMAPWSFRLAEVGSFPGVRYLAPEPSGPFVELTSAITARWPHLRPYGGRFDAVVPHVTIAEGDPLPAPGDLRPAVPIEAVAGELSLVEVSRRGWVVRGRYPFGG